MTAPSTTTRSAALWTAACPLGFVLLTLGVRDEGTMSTTLLVAAVACFVVATVAVAAARGRRPLRG